jgi:FMN-dependent oxidoreductase (nitrilotriacetate monooxygenase family)
MSRQLILNAFDTNAVGFTPPGQWRDKRDQSMNYTSMAHWANLARVLERGLFDGIFFQDLMGVLDVYGGNADAAIRSASYFPQNDPLMIIPIMAFVTEHLGFGVTGNLSYEEPYLFARRMSTLDHLTNGRMGWNIVTGYLDSAARALGRPGQLPHDERYEAADEFMDVVYKLWEGSWEDGAVIRDRKAGIYARPEMVHEIAHHGKYYNMRGIHRSEPSPQRTPVLYQAGSSARGRQFSSLHCECIFVGGSNKTAAGALIRDIRARAVANGRDPGDVKVIVDAVVVVARTESEAREKLKAHQDAVLPEGGLAMISAALGIDLAELDPDEPIPFKQSESNRSTADGLAKKSSGKIWTPRLIGEDLHLGRGSTIVGTPSQIADEFASWQAEADIDGFNICRAFTPGTFEDVADLLVPELQDRGMFKTSYREGTLRQKLMGHGDGRMPTSHIAARYRHRAAKRLEREHAVGD